MRLVRFASRQWIAPAADGGLTWLRARVPARVHALVGEVAKFGTIGVLNIFVNLGLFNLLMHLFPGGQVKAKAIAALLATTSAYFLNRHWTYRNRPKSTLRREYSLFFLFNAVGFAIEVSLTWLAKYGFDQTDAIVLNAVAIVGIVLGTVFRFWAYRTHVFKAGIAEPSTPATGRDGAADEAPDDVSALDSLEGAAPVSPAPALGALSIEAEFSDLELDQLDQLDQVVDPSRRS